jgi:hypothetical protein
VISIFFNKQEIKNFVRLATVGFQLTNCSLTYVSLTCSVGLVIIVVLFFFFNPCIQLDSYDIFKYLI